MDHDVSLTVFGASLTAVGIAIGTEARREKTIPNIAENLQRK